MNKYIIKKLSDRQYYWVLEDVYGRFLIKSTIFPNKEACQRAAHNSKNNLNAECFIKKQNSVGKYYFNQIDASSKELLASGNLYNEMIDRDIDITLVKSMARLSEIVDATSNVA